MQHPVKFCKSLDKWTKIVTKITENDADVQQFKINKDFLLRQMSHTIHLNLNPQFVLHHKFGLPVRY